jgi:hypothetical protein
VWPVDLWLLMLPVLIPFLVLVHEAGHALACALLRHPVHELRVGDEEPVLTVKGGGFRLRLGAVTGRRPVPPLDRSARGDVGR